jgi:hypothetical protein
MRVIHPLAAFAALALAACDGDGTQRTVGSVASGHSGGGTVVSVEVIGPGNLEPGSSATFYAVAFVADGDPDLLTFAPAIDSVFTEDVTWSTSDDAVLSVTGNGSSAEVTAVGDGAAEVLATIQGVTGSRTVTIGPIVVGPLESIELMPSDLVIVIHGDSGLGGVEAILRDAAGNRIWDGSVAWSVSDPTVLAFKSQLATFALLEALKPGTATVTAEAEGKSGSANVTVQ